jgi:hypothetical protein
MTDKIDLTPEAVERFHPPFIFSRQKHGDMHESPAGKWVRASDYDALSARLAEVEAERGAWMSDSAAAWDKCEERRLIQESAESAMERAYIAGLEEGARIVRLWDRASYRPEQPEPKYDSAHHNIATLASDPALVAAAVAKIMEGRG